MVGSWGGAVSYERGTPVIAGVFPNVSGASLLGAVMRHRGEGGVSRGGREMHTTRRNRGGFRLRVLPPLPCAQLCDTVAKDTVETQMTPALVSFLKDAEAEVLPPIHQLIRVTSLIRNSLPLGPNTRTMPLPYGGLTGGGCFL